MRSALELYELALERTAGPQPIGTRVFFEDGSDSILPVARFLGSADPLDHDLLAGVAGPVLDVGCGPGRHLRALTAQGVYALGVDLSPVAIEFARRDGAQALVADVFGDIPGTGGWATALLLDGNIGIGGCPRRLLGRLATLLSEDGVVLAEFEAPEVVGSTARARLASGEDASGWFPWARVSISEIDTLAADVGMDVEAVWSLEGRWFARLACRPAL